jgi:phenylacetic acid degradation operon negative regulatory protein
MPRSMPSQASPGRRTSPTRQVLTIFGDYWSHVDEPMPSGALVRALTDLGMKEAAARATLARMARIGLLAVEREGRRTTHQLTARAQEIVDEESAWLESFGRIQYEWDGLWSVLAFSIPESQRAARHLSRSRLRWLGYAPLYDGVWISPLDSAERAMAELQEVGVDRVTSMRARLDTSLPGGPQSAWDLAAIAAEYRDFADAAPSPDASGAEALSARSRLMLAWQEFRTIDVGLPAELLPPEWPLRSTRRMFVERYDALGPAAEERMRAHIAEISDGLSGLVTSRRLAGHSPSS